jgi:autotransporter-associated beta strand protein
VVIDQGAVFVTHNGSLGTGAVTVNRYGVLEIGVANYAPTNTSLTYNEGSIERWSIDSARSGSVNLGKATLQVGANQANTTADITLNGGGIQAYVNGDGLSNAQSAGGVLRILPSTVTFNLTGNSFLGDRFYEGANGLDSGKQVMDFRPMEEYLASGAILDVKGVISGNAGLTKVGFDTVILSGQNTYTGATVVTGGKLMIGADNALPQTGTVTTTSNGVLDLNGQNQTIGVLNNLVTTTAVNTTSGFITNAGTSVKTLTVGNATTSDFTYSGVIQHNVAVTMAGTGVFTLNNVNTYFGATTLTNGGSVKLGTNANIADSVWLNIGASSKFDVTAKTAGSGNFVFDGRVSGGGTSTAGSSFASAGNAARIDAAGGTFTIGDNVGEVSKVGFLAPGGNSGPEIANAGNQIGHVYVNGGLTVSGPVTGSPNNTTVDRVQMQLNGSTANAQTINPAWDGTASWLAANATDYLNGAQGTINNHDYVNVSGELKLNQYGRVTVSNFDTYTPYYGDVFNLFDWTTLTAPGFNAGSTQYSGGTSAFDLQLPNLSAYNLLWDTSLFMSYGTLVVVPEPGRALLMLLGLMALFMRRRRQD